MTRSNLPYESPVDKVREFYLLTGTEMPTYLEELFHKEQDQHLGNLSQFRDSSKLLHEGLTNTLSPIPILDRVERPKPPRPPK